MRKHRPAQQRVREWDGCTVHAAASLSASFCHANEIFRLQVICFITQRVASSFCRAANLHGHLSTAQGQSTSQSIITIACCSLKPSNPCSLWDTPPLPGHDARLCTHARLCHVAPQVHDAWMNDLAATVASHQTSTEQNIICVDRSQLADCRSLS
jgi:hypothetical protein